jgi:hypothetical protein
MGCVSEVPKIILWQVYLCTYSLLTGVTFEVIPEALSTYPNDAVTVRNIFGTPVVEQLSVPLSHFFRCLQKPEIFIPLRQTLFLETVTSHL